MLGRRRFFGTLNYSSQNEDWRAEALALGLQDGQRILAITGSGDRVLNLLALADVEVVAVDLAPAQNHLLRFKMAALRDLEFDAYVALLGLRPASWTARQAWAASLDVPPATRAWLYAHRRDVGAGLLYRGRFERWFALSGAFGRVLRGPAIRELLSFDDLQAQRRFLRDRWDRPWWRAVWGLMLHPCVTRVGFGDPAFYDRVDVPVGATLFDRIRAGLDRVLARESFMVHLVLTGRLSEHDLPPYLGPAGAARIRDRLHRITIVDGAIHKRLANRDPPLHDPFDAQSLSDLPSFLSPRALDALLRRARDSTRPGGRIVIRQFLTRDQPVTPPGLVRRRDLEPALAAMDRTFSYDFLVYEVADAG